MAEIPDAVVTSAEDPPTCSVTAEAWVVQTGPKKQKPIDKSAEEKAHVVYIPGTKKNVAKLNPLSLREKIGSMVGIVERIYISGASLKVYCTTDEQKKALLRSTQLDETEIICSEPVAGFGKDAKVETSQFVKKRAQTRRYV